MNYFNTITILLLFCLTNCKSKKEISPNPVVTVTAPASNETIGLNLGNKAPAINGKNYNDSIIHLSSLAGKMVLIDFWASWCAPCRKENPNVVKTYLNYKDKNFKNGKGFTVFGVSLDGNKDLWKAAVLKDNLMWANHVSDLKGWYSSMAKDYNITSIPYNYLINGNGIIVAINLRSESLSKTLDKYLSE